MTSKDELKIMWKLVLFLLFPVLTMAQVVNQCVDHKTGKSTFSDKPCDKLGLYTKKIIDGAKMSTADGLPRTNYVDENGNFIANRPVGWYEQAPKNSQATGTLQHQEPEIVAKCAAIKKNKLYWEQFNTDQARREAAELRYQYSKNNCHLVLK